MNNAIFLLSLLLAAFLPPNQAILSQQTPATIEQKVPLSVGALAPDFTLTDQQGRKVQLSAERGKRPVVLVFYRGYW